MSAGLDAKGLASRVGLGKLALYAWYRPRGLIRNSILAGGPIQQAITERGRKAMYEAADSLPELAPPDGRYVTPLTMLSGARFWHQTIFCIASLQVHAEKRIDPLIFDDGTLTGQIRDRISRVVPWVHFVLEDEVAARLEKILPFPSYPNLRARRDVYPHLRKLIDLHDLGRWSLVLDSDVLFFHRPDELLSWMEAPAGILYMQDAFRSYGYSDALMSELARGALPHRMNVGLYGLHGSQLDYDYLEYCCREMIAQEGTNYLQEQALTALLVSGQPAQELPDAEYRVLPDVAEGRAPNAAMHHYVAHSKRSYFQHGWRIVLDRLEERG